MSQHTDVFVIGAVFGAIVGYNGHRLFAFAKVSR